MHFKKRQLKSKRLLSIKYVHSDGMRQWARDAYRRKLYKEWEDHFFGTMPKEVYQVWMQGMQQFVSTKYYEDKAKAVELWPAWFPWEVKYNSIPKEVHDAYNSEITHELFSVFDTGGIQESETGHGGLMEAISNAPVREYTLRPFTRADFDLMVENFTMDQNARFAEMEAEKQREKSNKIRWDKYYKPFNLPYRP